MPASPAEDGLGVSSPSSVARGSWREALVREAVRSCLRDLDGEALRLADSPPPHAESSAGRAESSTGDDRGDSAAASLPAGSSAHGIEKAS